MAVEMAETGAETQPYPAAVDVRLADRERQRGTLNTVAVVAPLFLRSRVTNAVSGPSAVVHSVSTTPAGGRGASFGGLPPG